MNFKDVVNLKKSGDEACKDFLINQFAENPAAWLLFWALNSNDFFERDRFDVLVNILLNYEKLSTPIRMYEGDR